MALQGTADGGAILVASYPVADDDGSVDTDGVTEAYRLGADRSFLWQHTIDGDSFPVDVEQTDDRYDGAREKPTGVPQPTATAGRGRVLH